VTVDGTIHTTESGVSKSSIYTTQSSWSYDSTPYQATYTAPAISYSFESDMTFPGIGTTCYDGGTGDDCVGGTQIAKIIFQYAVPDYVVTIAYTDPGMSGATYNQPGFTGTATYFFVKSPDGVRFRVLGGASADSLTASDYLTRFKILGDSADAAATTGLCNSESATSTSSESWTSNTFTTNDATSYNGLLTANGWNGQGGANSDGAAACFSYPSRRTDGGRRSTASEVCISNGASLEDARAACVGALSGGGSEGMLESCVYDWCSFKGSGKILEQYFIEKQVSDLIDSTLLVSNYEVPVFTTALEIIQAITMSIPGFATATDFNAETVNAMATRDALEKAFGFTINIVTTVVDGVETTYVYLNGCNVVSRAAGRRRENIEITYTATIADADVAAQANTAGVTSTADFAANINSVASSSTEYSIVPTISASSITNVGTATSSTVTVAGGTAAPTSAAEAEAASGIETYIIILAVLGGALVLGVIIAIVVKVQLNKSQADKSKNNFMNESAGDDHVAMDDPDGPDVAMDGLSDPIPKSNAGVEPNAVGERTSSGNLKGFRLMPPS